MHAYLIVGENKEKVLEKSKGIATSLSSNIYEYRLKKIEEVRRLASFLKLSLASSTFIIQDIHEATLEALNSFLKALEEPQKNVNFILTAPSEYQVIPTIVSRCQVIKVLDKNTPTKEHDFVSLSLGEKFGQIDKIKKADQAKTFLNDLISILHKKMLSGPNPQMSAKAISLAQRACEAINSNANVGIQLTNLAINL